MRIFHIYLSTVLDKIAICGTDSQVYNVHKTTNALAKVK